MNKIKELTNMLSKFGIIGLDIREIRYNEHLNIYMVLSDGGETIFSLTEEAYEDLEIKPSELLTPNTTGFSCYINPPTKQEKMRRVDSFEMDRTP